MAFRAQKVSGAFEKRAHGNDCWFSLSDARLDEPVQKLSAYLS